jgi:SAM-dependent methyltransferase
MGRIHRLQFRGIPDSVAGLLRRRSSRPRAIKNSLDYIAPLRGLRGLEIGGPSNLFGDRGGLPLYREIGALDGLNFAREEYWHGRQESFVYHPGKSPGQYIVGEACNLPSEDGAYDFVMSSHVIEHCANPLAAVKEWGRVVHAAGYVLVAAPDKNECFDHKRALTSWEHLLEDFRHGVGEDDTTHLLEVIRDTDRNLMSEHDGSILESQLRNNLSTRWLHHHTFNTALIVRVMSFAGLDIVAIDMSPPDTILVLGRKSAQ